MILNKFLNCMLAGPRCRFFWAAKWPELRLDSGCELSDVLLGMSNVPLLAAASLRLMEEQARQSPLVALGPLNPRQTAARQLPSVCHSPA